MVLQLSSKPWKSIAVLALGVGLGLLGLAIGIRWHDRQWDPVVSGRPISHWLDVLDRQETTKAEQEEALRLLRETDQRAALQSRILDRIEDRYSSPSLAWYQIYSGVSPRVRRHLPVPQFARMDLRVLSLLNGISTNALPRQKAAMETVVRFGSFLQALDIAYGVALSEATQSPAEALALARRELANRDPVRRLGLCEALASKRGLDAWREHSELVRGLQADLARVVASDPISEVSVAARKALGHLEGETQAPDHPAASSSASGGSRKLEPRGNALPQSPLPDLIFPLDAPERL